jgi:hypothetical protein
MIRVTKPRDRRNCIKLAPCAWQLAKFCQKRANEFAAQEIRDPVVRDPADEGATFPSEDMATGEWRASSDQT